MKFSVIATLAASAALASASPAFAAKSNVNTMPEIDACSMVCDGPTTVGSETTIGFTEAGLDSPTFTEWLTFTNDLAGVYALTLDTSSSGIDFTSAILTGPGGPYELVEEFDNGISEFWNLSSLFLEAGTYTLTINGDNNSTGSLGGTVTINAVPEPGTWAMMLVGFGAAGYAMRRRRLPVLAQMA
jgi:hypothetical protein